MPIKMIKKEVVFITLLMGSLFFISSCTSNDAQSMSSEDDDSLALINDSNDGFIYSDDNLSDIDDLDELEKELDELGDLDLNDLY